MERTSGILDKPEGSGIIFAAAFETFQILISQRKERTIDPACHSGSMQFDPLFTVTPTSPSAVGRSASVG